jgi:hypothetical protein
VKRPANARSWPSTRACTLARPATPGHWASLRHDHRLVGDCQRLGLREVPLELRLEFLWPNPPLVLAGADTNHVVIRRDEGERSVQVLLAVGICPLLECGLDGRLGLRAGPHRCPSLARIPTYQVFLTAPGTSSHDQRPVLREACSQASLWVMSHLSSVPLGPHTSGTSPSTGALAACPQAAVPPCSWWCWLVS